MFSIFLRAKGEFANSLAFIDDCAPRFLCGTRDRSFAHSVFELKPHGSRGRCGPTCSLADNLEFFHNDKRGLLCFLRDRACDGGYKRQIHKAIGHEPIAYRRERVLRLDEPLMRDRDEIGKLIRRSRGKYLVYERIIDNLPDIFRTF